MIGVTCKFITESLTRILSEQLAKISGVIPFSALKLARGFGVEFRRRQCVSHRLEYPKFSLVFHQFLKLIVLDTDLYLSFRGVLNRVRDL